MRNNDYISREEDIKIIVVCVHSVLKASLVYCHGVDNRILLKHALFFSIAM